MNVSTENTVNPSKDELVALLFSFINQRPGLDPRDYGDWQGYRSEAAEISRDLNDARTLLHYVADSDGISGEQMTSALRTGGRLELTDKGALGYCTGQYWPTEYRPAVARLCAQMIWRYWGQDVESDKAQSIRERAKRRFGSRSRVYRFYFG